MSMAVSTQKKSSGFPLDFFCVRPERVLTRRCKSATRLTSNVYQESMGKAAHKPRFGARARGFFFELDHCNNAR